MNTVTALLELLTDCSIRAYQFSCPTMERGVCALSGSATVGCSLCRHAVGIKYSLREMQTSQVFTQQITLCDH